MRKWRWQIAANALCDLDPHLVWIVGVLSIIDERLYLEDQQHKELPGKAGARLTALAGYSTQSAGRTFGS